MNQSDAWRLNAAIRQAERIRMRSATPGPRASERDWRDFARQVGTRGYTVERTRWGARVWQPPSIGGPRGRNFDERAFAFLRGENSVREYAGGAALSYAAKKAASWARGGVGSDTVAVKSTRKRSRSADPYEGFDPDVSYGTYAGVVWRPGGAVRWDRGPKGWDQPDMPWPTAAAAADAGGGSVSGKGKSHFNSKVSYTRD